MLLPFNKQEIKEWVEKFYNQLDRLNKNLEKINKNLEKNND